MKYYVIGIIDIMNQRTAVLRSLDPLLKAIGVLSLLGFRRLEAGFDSSSVSALGVWSRSA